MLNSNSNFAKKASHSLSFTSKWPPKSFYCIFMHQFSEKLKFKCVFLPSSIPWVYMTFFSSIYTWAQVSLFIPLTMCTSASVANFFKHIFHTIQCRENYQAMHFGATMNLLSVMHEEIWSLSYQKNFQLHIPLILKIVGCAPRCNENLGNVKYYFLSTRLSYIQITVTCHFKAHTNKSFF